MFKRGGRDLRLPKFSKEVLANIFEMKTLKPNR